MIVEVERIEPGFHVLARVIELGDAAGEHLERFNVTVGAALGNVGRRLSSELFQILVEPRNRSVQSINLVRWFEVKMAFSGMHDKLCRNAKRS